MRQQVRDAVRMYGWTLAVAALLLAADAGAQGTQKPLPPGAEAWSLFGEPLKPVPLPDDARAGLEKNLAEAKAAYDKNPNDADALIWVGRRYGYLSQFQQAITVFTDGIKKHPSDPRMFRHRGHRYISVRQFEAAIADLSKAATLVAGKPDEVEPDGQPNARNIPTSTLQFNIYYHLALAHYLKGEFAPALDAYARCMAVSKNPDAISATSYWQYMTLRRLGRTDDAAKVLTPIVEGMDVIENRSYHSMLLVFKGALDAEKVLAGADVALDKATIGYGVGNWYFINGKKDRATEVWRGVLAGPQWAAFGYVASEADLNRMGVKK